MDSAPETKAPNQASKGSKARETRSKFERLMYWAGVLGTLGAALAVLWGVLDAPKFLDKVLQMVWYEDLPGSYPNERWRSVDPEDVNWLQDEWCYPALRGFRSRFVVSDGKLLRKNAGAEWIEVKSIYLSKGKADTGSLLRIQYPKTSGLQIDFIAFDPGNTAEWREHQRFTSHDGTVRSEGNRLALSCNQCFMSGDGMTYDCK